jgi:hypothetical protein
MPPAAQRGWKKASTPTSVIAAPTIVSVVEEDPARKSMNMPINTSGKPTPYAGPAAHGELFSGKE